jgi:hypothetical protein
VYLLEYKRYVEKIQALASLVKAWVIN